MSEIKVPNSKLQSKTVNKRYEITAVKLIDASLKALHIYTYLASTVHPRVPKIDEESLRLPVALQLHHARRPQRRT